MHDVRHHGLHHFVNPAILHETGMPLTAVVAATCVCAAFGSLMMGIVARYPIALAPGMGLNAYFTYTVVKGMGVPWEVVLVFFLVERSEEHTSELQSRQ